MIGNDTRAGHVLDRSEALLVPIYEYRCARCEHEFEELVSFSAADQPLPCPSCLEPAAERLLSTFAVRVSGESRVSSSGKSCGGCRRSSCATC